MFCLLAKPRAGRSADRAGGGFARNFRQKIFVTTYYDKKINKSEVILLLENIRSAENVGSIFRTADAAGVRKIYLAGYTPAPLDRFGRVNKKIATRALGAEKAISWESVSDILKTVKRLKSEGYFVVALEQAKNAVDYKNIKPKNKMLFIVGNEVTGVSKTVLKLSDRIAEIPMKGGKESLNVSVAFGIGVFRILNV